MRDPNFRTPSLRGAAGPALAGLLVLSSLAGGDKPGTRPFEEAERDLVAFLQGETVPVRASPALCKPKEEGPVNGRDLELQAWYFDDGGCTLAFPPRPDALVTSISEGGGKALFESPAALARLSALLDELRQEVSRAGLSAQQKLIVQSRAWEVTFGLRQSLEYHPEWELAGEASVRKALQLLEETRFSLRELAALPANLADLPRLAGAPEIESTVLALLRRDPGLVEVVPPSDLHADILLGRFTPRIFLTVADEASRERFRQFVTDPKTTYPELRKLPQSFPGVRGILVLYFNVFLDDGTIAPTEVVAFWQEYAFTDKVSFEMPFTEATKRIRFRVVEALRDGSSGGLRYEVADQQRMARRIFLDVKPKIPGMPVTTLRAHCLSCHRNQIATFDTHGPRQVRFSLPLQRSGREILTPYYEQFETRLREWKRKYLDAR